MRKALILIATILFITSCNNKQKESQTESSQVKVPTAAEIRNQQIQDSLKQVRIDSLELIAWGDVKFGMSMKEVLATQTFKRGERYGNSLSVSHEQMKNIREIFNLSNLWFFWANFKEKELAQIELKSTSKTATYIHKLVAECDVFVRNFTEKYGKPIFQKDKVNISEFNSGEEFKYAKFQLGDKNITILLGEDITQFTYYYKVHIENSKFPKKKKSITEKERKEIRQQIKEAEDIKANSF